MSRVYTYPDTRAELGQSLSHIELDIVRRIANGDGDAQIARALGKSPRTYRRHVRAAQIKLGARTRAHAVTLALLRGLINLRGVG